MFDINEQMTYLVYVMQKRMRRQMSVALDRDDITLEQFVVLYNLMNKDGINQKVFLTELTKIRQRSQEYLIFSKDAVMYLAVQRKKTDVLFWCISQMTEDIRLKK